MAESSQPQTQQHWTMVQRRTRRAIQPVLALFAPMEHHRLQTLRERLPQTRRQQRQELLLF